MSRFVVVQNLAKTLASPPRVGYCDSFLCRLRGLTFRSAIGANEGLLLAESRDSRLNSSIHMFFVPFDLAVFWINSGMTVVDKVLAKPWRPAYLPKEQAKYTLEIHPSRMENFNVGDQVEFIDAA
jgi:uncharacterized membrane protein (UPF0127 family)